MLNSKDYSGLEFSSIPVSRVLEWPYQAHVEGVLEDKLVHAHGNSASFHVTAYYAPQFFKLR